MANVLMKMLTRILTYAPRCPGIGTMASAVVCATASGICCFKSLVYFRPLQTRWALSMTYVLSTVIRRARLYLTGEKKDHYAVMTPEQERKYWKSATKDHMKLLRSDARFVGTSRRSIGTMPPVILSYTPALPPEKSKKRNRYDDYFITPKTYCKWHRMVFPGTKHPTIAEASNLRDTHDPEELRKINHIARMLPDDQVFPDAGGVLKPWSSKYQRKWRKWQESRDQIVVFLDDKEHPPSQIPSRSEALSFSLLRSSKSWSKQPKDL